jgi:hypothetical protein
MAKSDLLRQNTISKLCKQTCAQAENYLQDHIVIMVLTPAHVLYLFPSKTYITGPSQKFLAKLSIACFFTWMDRGDL